MTGKASFKIEAASGAGLDTGGARATATAINDQTLSMEGSMSLMTAKIRATIAFEVRANGIKNV